MLPSSMNHQILLKYSFCKSALLTPSALLTHKYLYMAISQVEGLSRRNSCSVWCAKKIVYHIRDDKGSSLYKFFQEKRIEAAEEDFIVLEKGYSRHLDRMIAESLFIKDHHPVLNEQKTSYKLNLFN